LILLTGSTGFIGNALSHRLLGSGKKFTTLSKSISNNTGKDLTHYCLDINDNCEWDDLLSGVQTVVHAAGKAHIAINSTTKHDFVETNLTSTLKFARQAASSGVQRFVYLSTLNINGISSHHPVSEIDPVAPADLAAELRLEVETALMQISSDTGMDVVIIRPPLVYGAGVKANFLSLLKLSSLSLPLPFGAVNNKRSMVYVENLVDFIILCIDHPNAANQTFLVSDGEDLSLKSLITYIRKAMGKSPLLLPVPVGLFKLTGKLAGKSGVVDRLVRDFQVDSSKARELLDWTPPYSVEQGIAATVLDFNNRKN
jgi:nucleoside-diphosphate-sugar epimerase